ncbi:FHA domain-containing protein [Waterburya agarophytonicola K14]|uniref:FHA domain-containing protein n=1 Tax=Waterburya agarophytonicola KI4 TaxID=2874699 RepID=A0A964BR07_9CYAN|nr:FHA domain-containing protein [Waterburya agarophytonicola]MCC0176551.1 FHA domain-containing protein [Waterburya agarophytonicola KI4]
MTVKPVKHREEHILILTDGKGHREIQLKNESYSLGRGAQCNIVLQSQFVSRHHATLIKRQGEDRSYYRMIDGNSEGRTSVNGLLINGKKVRFHDLKQGDKVIFGPQVEAIYEYREYDLFPTIPPDDPYDITLIDPAMIDVEED